MEEISGMAIVKILDKQEQITVMLKLKFIRNRAILNVTNNTQETMKLDPKEMIGVLDLRYLGYYKIKKVFYNKISVSIIILKQLMQCAISLINF